jgi:hypothetical protein
MLQLLVSSCPAWLQSKSCSVRSCSCGMGVPMPEPAPSSIEGVVVINRGSAFPLSQLRSRWRLFAKVFHHSLCWLFFIFIVHSLVTAGGS